MKVILNHISCGGRKNVYRLILLILTFLILNTILQIGVLNPVAAQSQPGASWIVRTSGTNNHLFSVTWSGNIFVSVGENGIILTSPDGVNWTTRTSGTTIMLEDITWSGNIFVSVGNNGIILTSPDGVNWTSRTSGTTNWLNGITWSGSQFVAVGNKGTILTSPDGANWTTRTSGTTEYLYGVTWSGDIFVAVGGHPTDGSIILTSPDGVNWATRTSGTSSWLVGVIWNGDTFVAVGGLSNGTILTSPDGMNWTARISGTTYRVHGIIWSGSHFVAVSGNGTILTSPDGVNWTALTSGSTNFLYGVTLSGDKFVVVGEFGTILTNDTIAQPPLQPALPKFLTLPFYENDLDQWGNGIRVGWVYDLNSTPRHRAIDFYKSPFEEGQYGSGTVFDVIAAAPGEAYRDERSPNASDGKWGYYVVIKHDEKDDDGKHYYTLYAHLEDNSINSRIPIEGNGTVRVERGEYLGKAGDSGARDKGVHLHLEVHRGFQETKLDPYDLSSGRDDHYGKIANTIGCGNNRLWTTSPPSHSQAVPLNTEALHGLWTGTYTATQGETALDLTISEENGNLYAHFEFGPLVTNPNVPEGSYYMNVELNPNTKEIFLAGREWVTRPLQPRKYYMVDLDGIVSPDIKEIHGDVLWNEVDPTPSGSPGQKVGEFHLKKAEHIVDSNDPPPTPGPTPKPDPVPTTKLGDITGNGNINVEDVTLTMQHVLGLKILTDDQKKAADVNGDGKVDVRDVVLIMRFVLGLIDNFPNQ